MTERRVSWMDGMRCIAMMWILIVHYISTFTPNKHVVFDGLLGTLLFGISGKLAVACFCVLLGYFASKPSRTFVVAYSVQRYLTFALQIFVLLVLYYAAAKLPPSPAYVRYANMLFYQEPAVVLPIIIKDSLLLDSQVLSTLWCVRDFVLGSILIVLMQRITCNGRLWTRLLVCVLVFAAMLVLGRLWIAICILGWLLRLLEEVKLPFKPVIMIAMIISLPFLIRRSEGTVTYVLNGVACVFVMYVIGQLPCLQKVIGCKPLAWIGSLTMELFLLHVPIFQMIETFLRLAEVYDRPMLLCWTMAPAVIGVTILAAFLWRKLMNKTVHPLVRYIGAKCSWL